MEEDPLSREGELQLYRRTRNQRVLQEAEQLASKCAAVLGVGEEDPDLLLLDGMDAFFGIKGEGGREATGDKPANPAD